MITRSDVLSQAVDSCLKDIYTYVTPSVTWEDFMKQNKVYMHKYKTWERFNELNSKKKENSLSETELFEYSSYPDWENKSINECIGPRPYEFYYLPKEILDSIYHSYVYAYRVDQQQNLLDIIDILKNYCKSPTIDKYIEGELREDGTRWPGHRGYEHPDNLEQELYFMLIGSQIFDHDKCVEVCEHIQNKFFEFLDMAGNFYNWNRDLNSFGISVYLGPSPNSNKEAVIENWKKYKNQDLEIDEEQIKKAYYGDDDDE